jgi:hypothetical protein
VGVYLRRERCEGVTYTARTMRRCYLHGENDAKVSTYGENDAKVSTYGENDAKVLPTARTMRERYRIVYIYGENTWT